MNTLTAVLSALWIATLNWLKETIWPEVKRAIGIKIDNKKREADQSKTQEALEKDINEQTPRDEDTKRREQDWMNS